MTDQVTEERGDENQIKEGQLLLQGEEAVQGVSKCVCKRCHCKVSKEKEKMIDKLQHMWNSLLYKLMFKKYRDGR